MRDAKCAILSPCYSVSCTQLAEYSHLYSRVTNTWHDIFINLYKSNKINYALNTSWFDLKLLNKAEMLVIDVISHLSEKTRVITDVTVQLLWSVNLRGCEKTKTQFRGVYKSISAKKGCT